MAGTVYVSDRENVPGVDRQAGRILSLSGPKSTVLIRTPQPTDLAVDPRDRSVVFVGDDTFAIFRVPSHGGSPSELVRFPPVERGKPTLPRHSAFSISIGPNGHIYYNNRSTPDRESIVELDPEGHVLRSFGGWRPGHGMLGFVLNKRNLRWIGDRLFAVGLQEGRIVQFRDGKAIAEQLIETRPYNYGPREVRVTSPGDKVLSVNWLEVLNDVIPLGNDRLMALIRQQDEDRATQGQVLGIMLNMRLETTGILRPSSDTPADRVAPAYMGGGAYLGDGRIALVDTAFRKRIDVFRLVEKERPQ